MDVVIEYDEVAGFLKNPPALEPRPNFANIRTLQKHIVQALAQFSCLQSAFHGWSGLAMDPAAYTLLEGTAFVIPPDPGPTVVFPGSAAVTQTVMKTTVATFDRDKNYFLLYKNITQACFCMLDANVLAQFKVSNNAALTGWNSTMSIIDILAQLQNSYGKPNMMMLFNNDTLFRSPMKPGDSPEMLFYRLEQCQEVQRIGKVPYSDKQIIANAIRFLATSNIFPLKEFDTREATAAKTYPALKTFFQETYGHCLTAIKLRTTTGQTGYTNNTIYNAFEATDEDTDDDTVNTIITVPQTAAAATTAVSTLNTAPSTMNVDIAAAISQLSANQTAIMTQMAAMSFAPASTQQATRWLSNTFQVPPIQQVAIPFLQQTFLLHLWMPGWTRAWPGTRGRGRTPFADHMRMKGAAPAVPPPFPSGGGMMPSMHSGMQMPTHHGGQQRAQNPEFSNIYKRFNNWNVCFLCGFDVEDGHTSLTCPFKKANHQTSFVWENAQQFIAAGYDPCTQGMHKTVLPLGRST
jgi:hypothetical protein